VFQRHAFEKFHGDEGVAFLFANVMDGADVGMIESRGGLSFTLEAGEGVRIPSNIRREEFQGDEAVEANVFRFVNYAHTATAEFFKDTVVRDGLAYQEGKGLRLWATMLDFLGTGSQRP
jgi:hypothetical protein